MWEITCKNVTSTFPSASGHHLADISFLEFELLPLLISLNWFPIFSVESIFISHLLSGTSVHNCIYIPWLLACPRMPFVYRRHHWICLTHKATLVSAAGWDTGYLQEATAQGAGNAKLNPARGQPSSRERLPIQQRRHEARENRPVGKEPPPSLLVLSRCLMPPQRGRHVSGQRLPRAHLKEATPCISLDESVWVCGFSCGQGETAGTMEVVVVLGPWVSPALVAVRS